MSRGDREGLHDWIGYLQPVGLVVAPAALARIGAWPAPQRGPDGEAVAEALATFAADPWRFFRDVLGWTPAQVAGAPGGPPLGTELRFAFREQDTLLEPDWAVLAPDGSVQLLVRIEGEGLILDKRGTLDGWEATAQQRFERLLRETGVGAGVLVGARETGRLDGPATEAVLRLVVAPRGEVSGHMGWPLDALTEVSGRGMLAGLKLLLDAHALFTGPPSHRLPALLAESRAAQADVSTRLAGQVLASLHELLRGLDAADPATIRALAADDPQHLYEGVLTVLLRLIFILYAEDRNMLPSAPGAAAAALYEQGYALGALHLRLRDDAALHPDTMDERRGGWGRLLALFRLIERGDPSGFLQARGGKLFAGSRFPFLLGRDGPDALERVLALGDGCVLRVLDGLLMLEGERVHYRNLSVEQIGSVYETVMGFTVERAGGPMLAIRAGKGNKVPVWVDLTALAASKGGDREKLLKEWTGRAAYGAGVSRALRTAEGIDALAAALAPIADPRACPRGSPVMAGVPILQPTDERRRTGSHYTPASLTRPIVTHALAPAFARIGPEATPASVLELRVCDPAAGSGAFLVEACRQLGERLVSAWSRWPMLKPTIPPDEDDLLHAKRLVAQHCLRGVDRNPLAIDLAKLSLWLETLARDHEFTFLDGVLRCGDSLVGLPNDRIMSVAWGKTEAQHTTLEALVRPALRRAAAIADAIREDAEVASHARQEERQAALLAELEPVKLVADAILAAFFSGKTARERKVALAEVEQIVGGGDAASWTAKLQPLRDRLRASPIGITSFHWELEFEDVFNRKDSGFDAIVGNPPFAGKNTIASGHALAYPDWLKTLHAGAHGNADLSAHFFRRAFSLLRRGGAFGLIATNTIRQGDTRETGLTAILGQGGNIYRAISRHQWEGEAAVVVAQVFVLRGTLVGERRPVLDGRPVGRISAYLMEGDLDGSPQVLLENAGKAFAGTEIFGNGFTFDDADVKNQAYPLVMLQTLRQEVARLDEVVWPYLGGEEATNDPQHRARRYVIDFRDYPLRRQQTVKTWASADETQRRRYLSNGDVPIDYPYPVAEDWLPLAKMVRARVKPLRDADNREIYRRIWWRFAERRVELYATIRSLSHVLIVNRGATPHIAFARVKTGQVFSKTLAVFALPSFASFATLQSHVHEVWTRFFASTLEDRLRYTPSDCFETFPLPPGHADAPALEAAGQAYHDHRAALMIERNEGMTPTYNRFHRRDDVAADIMGLRDLHAAMDRAVLAAYGWDDLAEGATPVFLDADSEDDHRYQGRLFWPAPFRDAVLARLLRLNEERAKLEAMR